MDLKERRKTSTEQEGQQEYSMKSPSTLPVKFTVSEKETGSLRREKKHSGFPHRVESKPLQAQMLVYSTGITLNVKQNTNHVSMDIVA